MLILDSLCLNSGELIGNVEITSQTHMIKAICNVYSEHCWTHSVITNYLTTYCSYSIFTPLSCASSKSVSESNNVSAEDSYSYSADKDYIYHSNG